MTKYRPTQPELNRVRAFACRRYNLKRCVLRPGIRFNLEDASKPKSVNVLLVSDHPTWDDTDLHDHGEWKQDFRRGVPLTDAGRAEVDLYVYDATDTELMGNVQAEFDSAGLVALHEDTKRDLWRRDQ